MPTPSPEIVELLTTFAVAMSAPTFAKALVLIYGAILAPGRRTVTAALRVQGLDQEPNFGKYHRVLNRDRWSGWVMSKLLLGLIVQLLVPVGAALVLLIDETLERRKGKKIEYKGWFRDAVRSTANRVTCCLGIRWCVLCILVAVPWSERPWALPFLAVPVLSEKTCARLGKPHRSCVEWAGLLVEKVRRWYPEREIVLVGDGAYAAVALVQHCQGLENPVKLTARLRLDAALFDFPGPQPKSKRGPKPKKGTRQPNLAQRLADPTTVWKTVVLPWYEGAQKTVEIVTGVSLWYTPGQAPVPLRWVLVRCPDQTLEPAAFFCSDPRVPAEQILAWMVGRWNIEVTFEEIRAHLGFETQRHWSKRAIERTTPCLFGLFSLVVLMAKVLHPENLPLPQASWYPKEEATFSDALAAVRRHLWGGGNYTMSPSDPDLCLIPRELLERLQQVACYTT
jgi:hypothetical protein